MFWKLHSDRLFRLLLFAYFHYVNELLIKWRMNTQRNAQKEFLAMARAFFADRIPYIIIRMVGMSANLEGEGYLTIGQRNFAILSTKKHFAFLFRNL